MWDKIVAFFMSIIAFIASLFGINMQGSADEMKNISYGDHERQVLDLYLPENTESTDIGLILMIHGGAWIAGDKETYSGAIEYIASSLGYAAAAINYRYLGEGVTLNEITDDIGSALETIKEKAAEKGFNITGVLLTGHSAGAHLSMLYGYMCAESSPVEVKAVVSYCGPTDLTDPNFYINNELGNEEVIADLMSLCIGKDFSFAEKDNYTEELKAVSPLFYVNENTIPTVINHGEKDTIVPYSNALSIIDRFNQYGVTYDFNSYPNSGHGLDNDDVNEEKADSLIREYAEKYL